ncbi:MAG: hypothetical protein WCJ19_05730 [bacterium]
MKHIDPVYGEIEIIDPVVLEIINCSAFQRLKGIDQGGYKKQLVRPDTDLRGYVHTRYMHCIGDYFLLKNFGAPYAEQIAGLIHDVSHTAFSHCIDYVLNEEEHDQQNHQDKSHEGYIKNSEFAEILKRNNLNVDYILDDSNFPLKENNIPDLCSDRIDYSLKTAVIFGEMSQREIHDLLSHLHANKDTWYFDNYKYARKFAELFKLANDVYYSSEVSAQMFRVTADFLKRAFELKLISEQDFYLTDSDVIEKIEPHIQEDEKLELYWKRLNDRNCCEPDSTNYDFELTCKSRAVDPLFLEKRTFKRVSDIDPSWKDVVTEELKPKKYFLKFKY